nr:reverse transcriptase domain-containing protein [Tanacetum cinerariifolium]
KDYAQIIKNQSNPGNIRHKIGSLHQKSDQRAFFYNNLANEANCQKFKSSRGQLIEESPVDTMADQRTMAKLLRAPTKGYAEAIVVPPILAEHFELKHSHINMMTSDLRKPILMITSIAKLTLAVNQQTSVVTVAVTAILKQFQATPPPASVKAVEEICITCGGAHPCYQCLTADGNTFSEFQDNIQGYVSAAAVNYNQGNFGYHPPGPLPSNTIANPKGELKSITTRSGLVLDGPFVLIHPPFINPEEDERVEETLTDLELSEFTIKVPPPLVQKAKPHSQRKNVVHQRDPRYLNLPYPSRMHKQKQQDKDEIQIHKFWKMFKQLHINITLVDALILILKYQKMLKALLSNKEKLLELINTPLNENCSTVILKKLLKKLGDPRKFLISCGFSELKCKALADLCTSINLIPLPVWKKLGLPELISTRMTLELANWVICTPAGIARDVFVPVGKFTFPADFVIVDYKSDPRVPLILGRPFLLTAGALINVHVEEMILRDEYLLNHDPTKEMDFILEDSIDEGNLTNPNVNLVDTIPEMFTNEHTLDYSSLSIYDDFNDDLVEFESDNEYVYDDPFDSKKEKIKEFKLLNDELDLPRSSDFLPSPEYDSFHFEDFSEVDALPSTNNEDKVFNLGILIHKNLSEVTAQATPDNNIKKISISHASLILEDFVLLFMNFLPT